MENFSNTLLDTLMNLCLIGSILAIIALIILLGKLIYTLIKL